MRIVGERNIRQKILIVCEGAKTEPNYFHEFKRHLQREVALIIEGEGKNTRSLVRSAIKERERNDAKAKDDPLVRKYDQVWAVFDKDDNTDNDVNGAIQHAESNDMSCAFSNQAFELWYLLHFNFIDTGIDRQSYYDRLTKLIGKKYEKNSDEMYTLLEDMQSNAIKNARMLVKRYDDTIPYAKRNPSTTVFLLVEELNQYLIESLN